MNVDHDDSATTLIEPHGAATTLDANRGKATTAHHDGPRCGALRQPDGSVLWRVWAPMAKQVALELVDTAGRRRTFPMRPAGEEGHGYFEYAMPDVPDGQRYGYRLDDSKELRADPASMHQPDGVAGPSAVVSPQRFKWTDSKWRGIPRAELVLYELHIGTFTPAGTFEAAIERLDDLRTLGVNAIEIMPVAQFPGDRNWGYDGVLPYAAQNTYGGPEGLAKLVDAAHARGIAVILDVVYNHLGPEAAYHRDFAPYFTEKYKTPWGDAVNYDDRGSDGVCDYVLHNARMWLSDFHLDGLRLDAVHAIFDLGANHILRQLGEVAEDVANVAGREIAIIAESDLNDPRILRSPERGGYGLSAQWSDDFHHAVHSLLTGERRGYYADYGEVDHLVTTFNTPFLIAGTYSTSRGRRHGAPPDGLSGDRFVVCIQNHDQVGNRAIGDRLTTIFGHEADGRARQRLAAALMLFSPHLPMLFMGEEYGETNPFPFFCSFSGQELMEAVRVGRKREFADFVDDPDIIPDPVAVETFDSAKLSWAWENDPHRAGLRRLYRDLIAARREWPALRDFDMRTARHVGGGVIELVRGSGTSAVTIYFNTSDADRPLPKRMGDVQAAFTLEDASYGGRRSEGTDVDALLPFECVAFRASI